MKLRLAVLTLFVLLSGALSGCAGPRINLWPIFFKETRASQDKPGELVTTTEVLYPFFATENSPSRHYHVLRPLYNYESKGAEGYHRLQYLWPLGLQQGQTGDRWIHRFWPFFQQFNYTRRTSGERVSQGFVGIIFPIISWGSWPPEGPYFAVFPLGGVTHGMFGDTFSFVAFPIYSYFRKGDYSRHNVLWPIFTIGGTPDGEMKLFRVWPFYVHRWKRDTYSYNYALWPFIRWGSQQWSTREEQYRRSHFAFNPLFTYQTTTDGSGKQVGYQWSVLFLSQKKDTREQHEESGWSGLLSLFRSQSTPDKEEFRILPFYWRTTFYRPKQHESGREWTRYRIMWPILWIDKSNLEVNHEVSNVVVAPFYWQYTTRFDEAEDSHRTERKITLWPLTTWQTERDGSAHFWILSHGWSSPSQGSKRNYGAFFDLFQYHSRANGEKETRLVSRLYYHKRSPAGRYLSVPLLVDYDSLGDEGAGGEKSCSFLLGLVKYCWTEKTSRWRILYIPL